MWEFFVVGKFDYIFHLQCCSDVSGGIINHATIDCIEISWLMKLWAATSTCGMACGMMKYEIQWANTKKKKKLIENFRKLQPQLWCRLLSNFRVETQFSHSPQFWYMIKSFSLNETSVRVKCDEDDCKWCKKNQHRRTAKKKPAYDRFSTSIAQHEENSISLRYFEDDCGLFGVIIDLQIYDDDIDLWTQVNKKTSSYLR